MLKIALVACTIVGACACGIGLRVSADDQATDVSSVNAQRTTTLDADSSMPSFERSQRSFQEMHLNAHLEVPPLDEIEGTR
jgi:predicted lipoprotein